MSDLLQPTILKLCQPCMAKETPHSILLMKAHVVAMVREQRNCDFCKNEIKDDGS